MRDLSRQNGNIFATVFLLTALLALAPALRAQQQSMVATPPPKPPTLAQALAIAAVPTDGVALTVSPETVSLPRGSQMPDRGISVDGCAERFGMIYGSYGAVTYLAPASMTLLNADPGEPNDLPRMGAPAALKILAGTLDDSQWQALTSSGGLGLSDLSSPEQQQLFLGLFPNHQLLVAPEGTMADPATATDLTADLTHVHIRLSQTAILMPSSIGGDMIGTHSISEDAPGQTRWVTVRTKAPSITQEAGQLAKEVVPNEPKISHLDYDQAALQTPVPLSDIATVGDLIAAVRQASGLEIYADPHYAQRTVVIVGSQPTATGKDLLRAVSICLTATFRKVGPAYVLTDDLPGVGALYKIWGDFADSAIKSVSDLEGQAGNALDKNRSIFDMPTFGDPIASTPQQETPDPNTPNGQISPESPVSTIAPFAQLTPAQQQAAQWVAQRYSAQNAAEIAKDPTQAPDMNGQWTVEPQYRLEALAPSFSDPIQLAREPLGILTLPSDDVEQQREKEIDKWDQEQAVKKAHNLPTLAAELAKVPGRAVLAEPQEAADIAPLVQAMQALGLNQLWLPIFREGVTRVPGMSLSDENSGDLLAAALAATRGTGITVYPVMDLLVWGKQPPDGTADLDILGETSVQAQDRAKTTALELDPDMPPLPGTVVSPGASTVATDLESVISATLKYPGLGGLVWRDVAPDGYDPDNEDSDGVGYTPAMRLAFLRRFHADPWDIPSSNDDTRVDLTLPNWDDSKADQKLESQWDQFRANTGLALMRTLYATARKTLPPAWPIFVDDDGDFSTSGWSGPWIDPRKPLPANFFSPPGSVPDSAPNDQPDVSQSQSGLTFDTIPVTPNDDATSLTLTLQAELKDPTWRGVVLDIAPSDGGPGIAGLRKLAGP